MEETQQATTEPQQVATEPRQIEKITLPKKEKHPGRVAAGKRLAAYNREQKLKKAQAAAAELESVNTQPTENWYNNCYLILGIVGVTLTAFGLYYSNRAIHKCPLRPPSPPATPVPEIPNAIYNME